MTAYAPSPYEAQSAGEFVGQQFSSEDRDKLQEIHELINLLLRELPLTAQAGSPVPAVPYSYSFFRFPCG